MKRRRMIEIRHRQSGRVFLEVEAETLAHANLMGEYLIHADLQDADLSSAQLAYANLSMANLAGANLMDANLRGANLTEADLSNVDFAGVNLTGATMSLTVLAKCRNLHHAKGLTEVNHPGPSMFDEDTLRTSISYLPNAFLRGAGYTWSEIAYLRKLYPAE
jgi:uncharacterized protein YjbI with pentapeptide repeats